LNKASPKITPQAVAEPEVLARARSGDRAAFAALYNAHQDQVFRYVRARVGQRQLAEDLTGDVFLRALSRIDSFAWTGHAVGAWLVTIARNIVADHYKSARVRYETPVGDILDVDRVGGSTEDLAVSSVLQADARRVIDAALETIVDRQAAIVRHRYFEDLTLPETAAAMGATVGAVKTATHRAADALRPRLASLRGAA
jgi:RNA polymerase sigma-70 factor, ECF subfamily